MASTRIIDWEDPRVLAQARRLAAGRADVVEVARACFEFVRDEIRHSHDFHLNPVTCRASEVLAHGTGFCYAKSHLLAALLRANGIPAGLCYQRLTVEGDGAPFCLHGLNAVYLPALGWYRVDARGNKAGVRAEFSPPVECLAFSVRVAGESDLPEIWPEPLPEVVGVLESCSDYRQVMENLPDVALIASD